MAPVFRSTHHFRDRSVAAPLKFIHQEPVCSRSDAVAERDNRIQRLETIDSCKFPLFPGTNNEFQRGNPERSTKAPEGRRPV